MSSSRAGRLGRQPEPRSLARARAPETLDRVPRKLRDAAYTDFPGAGRGSAIRAHRPTWGGLIRSARRKRRPVQGSPDARGSGALSGRGSRKMVIKLKDVVARGRAHERPARGSAISPKNCGLARDPGLTRKTARRGETARARGEGINRTPPSPPPGSARVLDATRLRLSRISLRAPARYPGVIAFAAVGARAGYGRASRRRA